MVLGLICVCVSLCVCSFLKKPEETSVQVERKGKETKKEGKDRHMSKVISGPLLALLFIFCKRF